MIGYMVNNVLPLRAGEVVRVYVVARRWPATGASATACGSRRHARRRARARQPHARAHPRRASCFLIPVPRVARVGRRWSSWPSTSSAAGALAWHRVAPAGLHARGRAADPPLARAASSGSRAGFDHVPARPRRHPHARRTLLPLVGVDDRRPGSLARARRLDAASAPCTWTLPWLAGWVVLTFVGFGVTIPSAPGYIGVFHAAAVLALSLFGVTQAAAVGYALALSRQPVRARSRSSAGSSSCASR